jgi:hypothetical protein
MNPEFAQLLSQPTVSIVEAGRILGRAKNAAYSAARAGDLPTIKVGKTKRVPTAYLRLMLGLEAKANR